MLNHQNGHKWAYQWSNWRWDTESSFTIPSVKVEKKSKGLFAAPNSYQLKIAKWTHTDIGNKCSIFWCRCYSLDFSPNLFSSTYGVHSVTCFNKWNIIFQYIPPLWGLFSKLPFGNQTRLARKSTINKGVTGNIIKRILNVHVWLPVSPWRPRDPWRWHYRPPESCLAGRDSRTLEDLQKTWPGDDWTGHGWLGLSMTNAFEAMAHDDLPMQNRWCSSSIRSITRGEVDCVPPKSGTWGLPKKKQQRFETTRKHPSHFRLAGGLSFLGWFFFVVGTPIISYI